MNDKRKTVILIIFFALTLSMMTKNVFAIPMNQDDQAAELQYKNIVTTRFDHLYCGNCTATPGDWIFWQVSWGPNPSDPDVPDVHFIYDNVIVELRVDGQLVEVEFSEIYQHPDPDKPDVLVFDVNYISPPLPEGEHRFDFYTDLPDFEGYPYESSVWVIVVPSGSLIEPQVGPTNPQSMNARFVKWDEKPHIIHILVFDDEGRSDVGQPPAQVASGQPVLFGYEWGGDSVDEIWDLIINNPDHDIILSIDGNEPFSIKSWYQDPFIAIPHFGPAWSWDHDGDGLGDGDNDGIGDWDGPVCFFRYQSGGLTKGTHTFEFSYNDKTGIWDSDLITIIAG